MTHNCPHCGKEINPAQMLGRVKSPKREAAWKRNGERLRTLYANQKKLDASGVSSNGRTPDFDSDGVGSIPAAPASDPVHREPVPETFLRPKPTTLEDKKARALAALAAIGKSVDPRTVGDYRAESGLLDAPRAPFEVNLEGEPHRVTTMGKRLGLYYLGAGEPVFSRYLVKGELEKLWEARVK